MPQNTKPNEQPVTDESLGIPTFRVIQAQIVKLTTDKRELQRLQQLAAVFEYRTNIAVKIARTESRWDRHADEERLKLFKAPEFFIDAAQNILNEVRETHRAKELMAEEKRAKQRASYAQRSWG